MVRERSSTVEAFAADGEGVAKPAADSCEVDAPHAGGGRGVAPYGSYAPRDSKGG